MGNPIIRSKFQNFQNFSLSVTSCDIFRPRNTPKWVKCNNFPGKWNKKLMISIYTNFGMRNSIVRSKIWNSLTLLTFYPFCGIFWLEWTTWRHMGRNVENSEISTMWRHRWAEILKILKCRPYNRIPHAKISLNAKFRRFIPFSREITNISPILGYFSAWMDNVTSQGAQILKILKFRP